MDPASASLDALRDIVELPRVSWWPLAVGWWVLLGLVLVALAGVVFHLWWQWRANAYRRAALSELRAASEMTAVAAILKRTALVAYPRLDVASLSGAAWCAWLEETGGRPLPAEVSSTLRWGVFSKQGAVGEGPLQRFASQWIVEHRCGREAHTDGS